MAGEITVPINEEPKGTSLVPDDVIDEELPQLVTREKQDELDAATAKVEAEKLTTSETTVVALEPAEVSAQTLVTVADPGEYVPNDYSFEVQVFDEENKNPKTVKVNSIEDWDKLLEQEANLGSALALTKGMRLATKMESKTESDKADYDKRKADYDTGMVNANAQIASTNRLLAGLNYLVDKGELPKIATKYVNADWKDPEVAKQDGVREQIELLTYMEKENKARSAAGLDPFGSVLDAYNAFVIDQARIKAKTTRTDAGQARKDAGAKVASPAPAAMTTAPKGIAVGRGGSLRDI